MRWMEAMAWTLAVGALTYGACGGGPNAGDVNEPAPTNDGNLTPGAMPSDGTQQSNTPPLDVSSGSSGTGGTPPPPGTIPPAESPNAPPSGIAPH